MYGDRQVSSARSAFGGSVAAAIRPRANRLDTAALLTVLESDIGVDLHPVAGGLRLN
jgi:hypothetical protein